MVGKKLLHYEITEKLGEGGMGVVYKARDTHLDRFVAIKVLPPGKVADAGRKARFVQEAKAASALNHPNIIHIYDISSDSGHDFIAMEYVAGKTLDQIIPRKGMRLNDALKIAVQIADALTRAHAAGIVHRDLKPSNLMLDEHGLVKVLDFGLAKLTEAALGEDEATRTAKPHTEEGTVVGTAAYMSPEQAEGKPVDARSDIFSFGAVLYEMFTGHRAFQGDSKMSTLSAVLHKEPVPLNAEIPHDLQKAIMRCLRKDLARRFQHMADVKVALEELKEDSESGKLASTAPAATGGRSARRWRLAGAAAVLAGAAAMGWYALRPRPEAMLSPVPLTTFAGRETAPAFSPDGQQVAFAWNGEKQDNDDIYVQLIGSGRPLRLTSDPAWEGTPAWSPDGRQIAFLRALSQEQWGVFLVPPLGGPEREVTRTAADRRGRLSLEWSPDSRWLAVSDRASPTSPLALLLVSVETGERRPLTFPQGTAAAGDVGAAFSPDGRSVAFNRLTSPGAGDTYVLALGEDLSPKGEPRRVTSGVFGVSRPAWTQDGRAVIVGHGSPLQGLWRIPVTRGDTARRLDFAGVDASQPAVSRTAKRLVYTRRVLDANVWAVETEGAAAGQPRYFLASTRLDGNPQFSPDGKKVAFASDRAGSMEIWVCDASGANATALSSFGGPNVGTPRWSPDGRRIVFDAMVGGTRDLFVIDAHGGKARTLTTQPTHERVPSWSRDGRWIYFSSNRGGTDQIWRMPAEGGEAVQVTRSGGFVAFESWDGTSLYYTKSADAGPLFQLSLTGGEERKVLESVSQRAFAVTAKGIYFISARDAKRVAWLQFLELASGKTTRISGLDRPVYFGLTVSPDGRTVLYSQNDLTGSDLMLVENFR